MRTLDPARSLKLSNKEGNCGKAVLQEWQTDLHRLDKLIGDERATFIFNIGRCLFAERQRLIGSKGGTNVFNRQPFELRLDFVRRRKSGKRYLKCIKILCLIGEDGDRC